MQDLPALEPLQAPDSVEKIDGVVRALESLVDDRRLLSRLPEDVRVRLKKAAGRLSRPDRLEQMKTAKLARGDRKRLRASEDRAVRAQTLIRRVRGKKVYRPPEFVAPADRPQAGELNVPRNCYVCKAAFQKLHFFYDSMCPGCAESNYAKRGQSASLDGWTAVITGARLKIGYQAALMMLRAGARVIATTRFPHDAAERYAREADYDAWGDRLDIHGLDLRHSPSVELFARYLAGTRARLDILVNNAAQTVRRPPGFYAHLLEREGAQAAELGPRSARLLDDRERCRAVLGGAPALPASSLYRAIARLGGAGTPTAAVAEKALAEWREGVSAIGILAAAHLSQIPYSLGDAALGVEAFPPGEIDADLQQVDKRCRNTWRLPLAEVPTAELIETTLINAVAPFILAGKLKPLMLKEPTGLRHIVNVSAMEGSFSRRTKTDKHPHTNMAKAALNMMTLTSAPDYHADGIHMNAVDTGWVTDEDPLADSLRKRAVHDFEPPLDIVDGAARVCDPFFSGLITGEHVWGKFLKDYKPTSW